jgi:hypothetical protein
MVTINFSTIKIRKVAKIRCMCLKLLIGIKERTKSANNLSLYLLQ